MSPERTQTVLALLRDPATAGRLSAMDAASILAELVPVHAALAARVQFEARAPETNSNGGEAGRLLTPEQAADRIGVTKRWLHRHSKDLPFARHLGRKTLRFWEPGLERWMREKRA